MVFINGVHLINYIEKHENKGLICNYINPPGKDLLTNRLTRRALCKEEHFSCIMVKVWEDQILLSEQKETSYRMLQVLPVGC